MSLVDAARWVVDGLAGMDGVRWFTLDRARPPEWVADARVWRTELPSGEAMLRASHMVQIDGKWIEDTNHRPKSFAEWPSDGSHKITRAELAERGALHLVHDDGRAEFEFDAAGMAGIPGRPALRGAAGLFELLREQWCERIEAPESLDYGELAAVAVPAAALAALPWLSEPSDSVNRSTSAGLASGAVVAGHVGTKASGLPTDEELLKEWQAIKSQGSPTATLATKYGVSKDTIQRRCKKANDRATQQPKAVSSVFEMGKKSNRSR